MLNVLKIIPKEEKYPPKKEYSGIYLLLSSIQIIIVKVGKFLGWLMPLDATENVLSCSQSYYCIDWPGNTVSCVFSVQPVQSRETAFARERQICS